MLLSLFNFKISHRFQLFQSVCIEKSVIMSYHKGQNVNNILIIFLVTFSISVDYCQCSPYRVRANNRLECRDKVPRKLSDLPNVVLTGYIEQIYPSIDSGGTYTGSVLVKRVLRGPSRYQGNRVTIDGFGDRTFCYSRGEPTESWIFQLTQISEGYFRLNGTMLKLNLDNLDRMNVLVEGNSINLLDLVFYSNQANLSLSLLWNYLSFYRSNLSKETRDN